MKMIQKISTGIALLCVTASYAHAAPNTPDKPRLILAIVVDQFREDYTTRFRPEYTGGIAELLDKGAVFPDAHQDHYPTVTAAGHATLLTGSVPATSGIIGNEWYDRKSGKVVAAIEDPDTTLTGDPGVKGASPHNLVVSTVGDELKTVEGAGSKVISVSMKDRAAILMAGRMADAAYWFDPNIGGFVSSSWYEAALPTWMKDFNARRLPDQYLGRTWTSSLHPDRPAFLQLPGSAGKGFYGAWEGTPFANDVLEQLAETALRREKLGQHSASDVLAVSFSANDVLGHRVGPDAPEVEEMCVQTDHAIAKLIHAAEMQVGGPQNLLIVFTADHGVAPLPEVNNQRKLPGTRIHSDTLLHPIRESLRNKFGEGNWILSDQGGVLYLNDALITKNGLSKSEVEETAARTARGLPGVARVYTRHQFEQHLAMSSTIDQYMARGFFAERSGDVYILMEPYAIYAGAGTNHGTPYDYDSHVPLIFYGWRITPGHYTSRTGISDVAPTLAFILNVETPSGSVGHILSQMIGK